ncbi:hypothetical protein A2U09_07635 [Fusobacterium necrophorum subsp. funduliforme]|uniref:hypothetical protein n=1 Tax=Fusobacterium necrophorum TaxID=859 RepID=UPI0007890C15|nr:hypothetical protein [Fusobacterium necrophorum]KYM58521.1 hypothetical protein A2U09_07635 [Fusobacterium necrophorum subsp. funduliforme]
MEKEKILQAYRNAISQLPNEIMISENRKMVGYNNFSYIIPKGARVIKADDEFLGKWFYIQAVLERCLKEKLLSWQEVEEACFKGG